MKRYFYSMYGVWLNCFAKSRAHAADLVGPMAEEILTEKEALKRAKDDDELRGYIQSSYLCDLMCN